MSFHKKLAVLLCSILLAWKINEPHLPWRKKTCLDVMQSHQYIVQDVFQSILNWPHQLYLCDWEMKTATYLMHKMQSDDWLRQLISIDTLVWQLCSRAGVGQLRTHRVCWGMLHAPILQALSNCNACRYWLDTHLANMLRTLYGQSSSMAIFFLHTSVSTYYYTDLMDIPSFI